MKNIMIAAALFLAAWWLQSDTAWTDGNASELDISAVTSVIVTGSASAVHLTTSSGGPYKAFMKSRRKGWFAFWYSSWSSDSCDMAGAMKITGTTLTIDTDFSSWSWFDEPDCRVDVSANLHEGSAVSIDQKATLTKLAGDFSSLRVESHAGDISLEGHARDVEIHGNAIQARLAFDTVHQDETITLDGNALNADISFPAGTPINYSVRGTAAFVDSILANTQGVKPAISISGNFIHARIR